MTTLTQAYKSAYYVCVGGTEHYMMFNKIRTRHSSMDEALQLCEKANALRSLPDVNVYKSSIYRKA